jgi:hypothetical protein
MKLKQEQSALNDKAFAAEEETNKIKAKTGAAETKPSNYELRNTGYSELKFYTKIGDATLQLRSLLFRLKHNKASPPTQDEVADVEDLVKELESEKSKDLFGSEEAYKEVSTMYNTLNSQYSARGDNAGDSSAEAPLRTTPHWKSS